MEVKLARTTFSTSRLLEFCSEKELVNQTGHKRPEWPLVGLKELVDNALDACEESGVAPEITVNVDAEGIEVVDNGPGIPAATIDGVLDYAVRVSSREAYVSPCRGQQGNALKTILAMPFVLDGRTGRVDVTAGGERHEITFAVDEIRQQPVIGRTAHEAADVKTGTSVKVHWPGSACSELRDAEPRFLHLALSYAFLNPHLDLCVDWFGVQYHTEPTDPGWPKWLPNRPTSAHWYGPQEAARLVAAYISHDRDRGVEERFVGQFIREFSGLSGTAKAKAVLEASGLGKRTRLAELANGHGLEREIIDKLFGAMREHSKPIKPAQLGVIGREHIAQRFKAMGVVMESFQYRKVCEVGEDGLPAVTEVAFGWRGEECREEREIVAGVNWSPGIVNPYRTLGNAYGDGLAAALAERYAGLDEPIVFLLHVACPRVRYLDRGKSSVVVE